MTYGSFQTNICFLRRSVLTLLGLFRGFLEMLSFLSKDFFMTLLIAESVGNSPFMAMILCSWHLVDSFLAV